MLKLFGHQIGDFEQFKEKFLNSKNFQNHKSRHIDIIFLCEHKSL